MSTTATPLFTKAEVKARIAAWRANGNPEIPDYNLACFITNNALIAQTDKAGGAYAHHTIAVSTHKTDSETKMCVGMLHDLLEDSGEWAVQDLRDVGFSKRIVDGVDAMTKRDGELYFDFIERCSRNPDSLDVKISDLNHNLTLSRNNFLPTEKDKERWTKYILSYNYLVDIKRGNIEPGSSFVTWMNRQSPELQDFGLLRENSLEASRKPVVRPVNAPHPG